MSRGAPSRRGSARAAVTIVATNYLAQARVLARSFRRHNPGARFFTLLIDEPGDACDPAGEPFETVRLAELGLPDLRELAFKYTVLELSTAVKPFVLEWLMERKGVRELLYLDPDIMVFAPLAPVYAELARDPVVLTPHITEPVDDGLLPDERTFLRVGVFNLGFAGVADAPSARAMLRWWQARCREHGANRPDEGLFVDQKWMDLVPGLFAPVGVLTDPGCNVAYWNLHGRRVRAGAEPQVNGVPLRFFHYSGYDPQRPEVVSKHQTRFAMADVGDARRLFALYRERLLAEGHATLTRRPYGWERFADGTPIPALARDLYLRLGAERARFGDPFAAGPGSFLAWLQAPSAASPLLGNLMAHVPAFRKDVARAMPDALGRDAPALADWFESHGWRELGLDRRFARRPRPAGAAAAGAPPAAAPAVAAPRADHSGCRVCLLVGLLGRVGARWAVRRLVIDTLRPAVRARSAGTGWSAGAARTLRRVLQPCDRHHALGNLLGPDPLGALAHLDLSAAPAEPAPGVNLVGYLTTESGVGEAARLMARALRASGLPHALVDFELNHGLPRGDATLEGLQRDNPWRVNLVHVNADQVPVLAGHYGAPFFAGRHNVGYWMWELPDFPREWAGSFRWFDEVWAPSRFTAEAIRRATDLPVRHVPLPVVPWQGALLPRRRLRLPEDRFVFLFLFDMRSVFERKNPLALVQAFRRAFGPRDRALLLLKASNGQADPEAWQRLQAAAAGHAGIRLLDAVLPRQEVASLLAGCDAYVSLHRSEGFGLTMAEAMALGKPVIATHWSGNADFMTPDNSFPVRSRLVRLERDEGAYRKGSRWAEPDVEHAAELMREVFENREQARRRGERARQDMRELWSPEAVGRRLRDALGDVLGDSPAPASREAASGRASSAAAP